MVSWVQFIFVIVATSLASGQQQQQDPNAFHFNYATILQDTRHEPQHDGSFGFLYRTEDGISHAAKGDPTGAVHGRFTYTDPTGLKVNFNYNAGAQAVPGGQQQVAAAPAPAPLPLPAYRSVAAPQSQQQQQQYDDYQDDYQYQQTNTQQQYQPQQYYQPQPQYQQQQPVYDNQPRYSSFDAQPRFDDFAHNKGYTQEYSTGQNSKPPALRQRLYNNNQF